MARTKTNVVCWKWRAVFEDVGSACMHDEFEKRCISITFSKLIFIVYGVVMGFVFKKKGSLQQRESDMKEI
jgi:hypothetical protein